MGVTVGERRIVSVLVADVAGSTPIAERLGPERSKFLFDEVIRLMRQEVERLGGTVAQYTGDGVLALFGAPTAHEDDAERAVRAALAIHDALGRYDADVGPAYGIELRARVAVNTGPVVVPAVDEPPERLYNALGDTVNVAARLEGAASGGGVCIGEPTAYQVRAVFELDPLGALDLEGRAEPMSAFVVAGIKEIEGRHYDAPFVGRQEELAVLDEVFTALLERSGAVVSITGEPGIGKSRLIAIAKERWSDRVRFLEGHAVAYAENVPYWPLRGLLRDWLGLGVSDPEARVRLELRAGLSRVLGIDAEDAYTFIATLLGLPLEDDAAGRLGDLSRDSIQRQTTDWLLRLLSGLARERPLCLVLEDLHWADEATLVAVEELLGTTDDEAAAVVLVHRSDPEYEVWQVVDRARRRFRHRFRGLDLDALGPDEARRLADGSAGAELPEPVSQLLAERSGGNPFFLEEALRDLFERGALRRINGRLELATAPDTLAVPALVQEALQARLDRLPRETRDVLSVAAVIGHSFGLPLLERLLPREQLRNALAELQRLELIVEERRQPAREYRFRHGLVQEVAYASLVENRRRELHLRVGEALEELHRDSLAEVYGLLAYHFSAADDATRAADYLLAAGDAARFVYAEDEALDYYRAALPFLDRLGDSERARATLFKTALAHHLAFHFAQADAAYRDALRLPTSSIARGASDETIRLAAARLTPVLLVPGGAYDREAKWLNESLYRGLLRVDRELNVVPAVADRVAVSEDGRTYSFGLDTRARWSDGSPVKASDFVRSLEHMRTEQLATAHLLDDVEDVDARHDGELRIRLARARSYFPYLLAQWWYPLAPGATESAGFVSNGPYRLQDFDDEHALFVANPRWHGCRGNVGAVELLLLGYGDEKPYVEVWVDGLVDIGFQAERRAVEAANTIIEVSPRLGVSFLHFRSRPPFDDELVRRAFAHAVDDAAVHERIMDARDLVADHSAIASRGGLIPPAMPGHGHRAGIAYDLQEARRLLADAGYPNGQGLPRLAVTVSFPLLGEIITEQFAELGADVDADADPAQVISGMGRGEAHVTNQGWEADWADPDGMLGTLNRVAFRDAEADDMLATAATLTDREERLRLYQAVDEHLVARRAHAVPTAYNRGVTLRRPWIDGFWTNALILAPFDEIVVRPELRP